MKSCCGSTGNDSSCKRKDGKTFSLPRKFSKSKCKNPKGFTMRSSCAPYKYCSKGGKHSSKRSKNQSNKNISKQNEKNILNKSLQKCSTNPLTGYLRDGYCKKDNSDMGNHLVCAKMNKKFLEFTKNQGNDLSSVVKENDKWCLCQNRWLEAYQKGKAPKVILESSNSQINPIIKKQIINLQSGGKNTKKRVLLPKLRPINNKNVKHKYKLSDPQSKRILAINEGIRDEAKKTGKTLKKAAISKKGRFNILRIYRKNKRPQECKKITNDMKYIDKKYSLGKTTNICKDNKIGGKKDFLYNPDNPKKSFDVYIDKNPKDTIPIKYKTLDDVESTIKKLERLYKNGKYPHKRIWQVGMIMKVRLESLKSKKPQQYKLANKYFKHLGKRSKIKNESDRKKFVFEF